MAGHDFTAVSQQFLDESYYTDDVIEQYERIFGDCYASNGGEKTNKEFVSRLGLSEHSRVLDVACGAGSSALLMARHYGAHVTGLDLSANMIRRAEQRRSKEPQAVRDKVRFVEGDVLDAALGEGVFDVVYSRDALFHVPDKHTLVANFWKWLKPGGKLFVTDLMRGPAEQYAQDFGEFAKKRAWNLIRLEDYRVILESVGFKDVVAQDLTQESLEIFEEDVRRLEGVREAFEKDYSREQYVGRVAYWRQKAQWTEQNQFTWGLYQATK